MQRRSKSSPRTRTPVRISSDIAVAFTSTDLIAKSQLTKSNLTKTKMENLARELQKVRSELNASPNT